MVTIVVVTACSCLARLSIVLPWLQAVLAWCYSVVCVNTLFPLYSYEQYLLTVHTEERIKAMDVAKQPLYKAAALYTACRYE